MSAPNNQEQLRDDIASMLELSRASWRLASHDQSKAGHESEADSLDATPYPRSLLFKTLGRHPLMVAAATAIVWRLGPAKFGAMAVAGTGLFIRHRFTAITIAQQLFSSPLFKNSKKSNSVNHRDISD